MASVFHQILADINPFDGPAKPAAAPKAAATPATPTVSSYDPTSDIAQLDKEIQAEQANYASLQANQAAQPKLPVYNTSAAYATAQNAATAAVDPVYQDKLAQYLQGEQLTTAQNTTAEGEAESDAASTLSNETADNATNRDRTTEDTATKTGDLNQATANYQADSGTAFDKARTALIGNVANSGLTTSGIGQGQVASSTADRNAADAEETETQDNSARDIQTAATRTFQDLATSDTRNTAAAATTTSRAKETLQNYIDNANVAEQGFRTSNEEAEQGAIESATNSNYSTGVNNFIASLIGSGASAQDVALAKQVYGS